MLTISAQAFSRVKTCARKNLLQLAAIFRRLNAWRLPMRLPIYMILLFVLVMLAACQTDNDPKTYARQLMHDAGRDSAKITKVVIGDKKYRHADDLWCIATDASSSDGQVPYLLAVWRKDGKWDGAELAEGYYEWDLYGCPR